MAHLVEDNVMPANYEDKINVEEDPLAWVALETRNKSSCSSHDATDALNCPEVRAEGAPANWILQIPH